MHDNEMPDGWHTIKSVLLKEIRSAATFHLCSEAASALFHARLIGESIARESAGDAQDRSRPRPMVGQGRPMAAQGQQRRPTEEAAS